MTDPDADALLRAIVRHPDDDTPRLVYADWLQENGDEDRAEFIRLQIAVAEQPNEPDPRSARIEELRKKNWKNWRAELPRLSGITWASYFWRGFVSSVSADTSKWLIQQRGQVFESAPIQSLVLNDAGLATLQAVLDLPEAERLTGLTIRQCRIREGEWQALARCPRLTRLKGLRFDVTPLRLGRAVAQFGDDDARAFVETPHLPRLEVIHIDGVVTPTALELLRTRFKMVKAW